MLPGLLAPGRVFRKLPGMALQFPSWLQAGIILCLIGFWRKGRPHVPLHSLAARCPPGRAFIGFRAAFRHHHQDGHFWP